MKEINLEKIKKIHFIGIGGIGVSALARMMLGRGAKVSGSDMAESRITKELSELGAEIYIGHDGKNLPEEADLVVYTIAVKAENPELKKAGELGIPAVSYPEFLGIMSEDYYTIAISGTHGKTTTTAIISDVLWNEGINPTVVVGSLLKNGGTNFIKGDAPTHVLGKDYPNGVFVVEACEYQRSFLNLNPQILIITNIDNDHLDFYRDLDDIISAFGELAQKVPRDGFIIANTKNNAVSRALKEVKAQIVDYSPQDVSRLNLKVSGGHNRENAKAVMALVSALRSDPAKAEEALENFEGTWRRFEYKGKTAEGVLVYDDYAHHPTEIKATLSGAREKFPGKRIVAVFQPHLYSRTKLLLEDFAQAFGDADLVVLAPIYAAREKFDPEIDSEILAEKIGARALPDFESIENFLKKELKDGDILITMGAGDVYKVGEELLG